MKKILVLVSAVLLVAAACNSKTQTTMQSSTQSGQMPAASSGMMSLNDLMSHGSQTCTFSDAQTTGTVFIGDGKTRTDVASSVNGKITNVHSIMESSTIYSWIDGQSNGFKMSTTASSSNPTSNTTASGSSTSSSMAQQQVDPNKQENYHCGSWTVDNSKFDLPTGINFMDMSALMAPHTGMPVQGLTMPPTSSPTGK